jgi:cytochrome c2
MESTATATPADEIGLSLPGDPAVGEILFNTYQPLAGYQCATCHRVDSEERLIGPGLLNVSIRAQTRVAGQSALDYLYTSITQPGAVVLDTYPDLMPKTWRQIYTDSEIYDIVAYLLTLQSEN